MLKLFLRLPYVQRERKCNNFILLNKKREREHERGVVVAVAVVVVIVAYARVITTATRLPVMIELLEKV